MRRYLSKSGLDEDEFPDQRKKIKKARQKLLLPHILQTGEALKNKEDAFDNWTERQNTVADVPDDE